MRVAEAIDKLAQARATILGINRSTQQYKDRIIKNGGGRSKRWIAEVVAFDAAVHRSKAGVRVNLKRRKR